MELKDGGWSRDRRHFVGGAAAPVAKHRGIALLLVVLVVASSLACAAAAATDFDLNCDGTESAADAVAVTRVSAIPSTAEGCAAATPYAGAAIRDSDLDAVVEALFAEPAPTPVLEVAGFSTDGLSQCDLQRSVHDIDVVQDLCPPQDQPTVEPFLETRLLVELLNHGAQDLTVMAYQVGAESYTRIYDTRAIVPGARCGNAPAQPCSAATDCEGLGGTATCEAGRATIEMILASFMDKQELSAGGMRAVDLSMVFSAADTGGQMVDAVATYHAVVGDFMNCDCRPLSAAARVE